MTVARTEAMAHLPLLVDAHLLGVLAVAWDRPREIDADERGLLTTVAEHTAHALLRSR